jgi:secondary thiamine-phosphate synthase enzyme
MIAEHYALDCSTRGDDHIVDLTDQVQRAVADSGVTVGQAALLVHGSTAALTTVEYEPGLVNHDVSAALERIAPRDARYEHEETWHDDNGHSHVRASLVGPSLALPGSGATGAPTHVEHALLAARPDQRRQLRGPRGRLVWRGDNFGPWPRLHDRADADLRDGRLYTVAGSRARWWRSTRRRARRSGPSASRTPSAGSARRGRTTGKGVAYAEVDGRGVIYLVTPGFFLHALDAKTGGRSRASASPSRSRLRRARHGGHARDARPPVRSDHGHRPRGRRDHDLVAADRRERRGHRRQLAHQGGGYPDASRTCRRHPRFDARTGEHLWKFHT